MRKYTASILCLWDPERIAGQRIYILTALLGAHTYMYIYETKTQPVLLKPLRCFPIHANGRN